MIAAAPALALSPIAAAIKTLYGVATDINHFIDDHIDGMKCSPNPTVARSGRVLEAAKFGFGMGYLSSVVIIAAGQLLLGNTGLALGTVASAAVLANPFAMTCAALGAIVYGYAALSDVERNELLETLSRGVEVGVELIRSIIHFAIDTTKKLLSADNMQEMKRFINDGAKVFRRTLGDVTGRFRDKVADATDKLMPKARSATNKATTVAYNSARSIKRTAGEVAEAARGKLSKSPPKAPGPVGVDKPATLK